MKGKQAIILFGVVWIAIVAGMLTYAYASNRISAKKALKAAAESQAAAANGAAA